MIDYFELIIVLQMGPYQFYGGCARPLLLFGIDVGK